jgi:hypothetical protein
VAATARKAARPARIVHHVPGRMRIKVIGAAGETAFFAAVQQVIGALQGVDAVRVNPSSSSIVIDYRPSDTVFHFRLQNHPELGCWLSLEGEDALLAVIDESVTEGARYLAQHSRLAENLVSTAELLDANLRKASDGYLDLKMLLPLGVAVATSLHKARSRGTPMWMSLGTFAFNAFLTLHRHRIDAPSVQIVSRSRRHV